MRKLSTIAKYFRLTFPWRAFVIWLAMVGGTIATMDAYLFREVVFETDDAAANGLQIRRAKSFEEIEGNYSRWGFHHPGPAMFYLFAGGETLFYDRTRLTASPHAAHVLTHICFQCACFAWGIDTLARRSRRRWFLALALLLWITHFSTIRFANAGTVARIWPPHILSGPLFLYLVRLAEFAAGSNKAIPAVTFLGGVLVHSHVGQLLQVVPLFLIAGASYLRERRHSRTARTKSSASTTEGCAWPYFMTADVILLIFLAPMAIEALSRPDNNFVRYAQLNNSSSPKRSWSDAATYLGTFFFYSQRDGDGEFLDVDRIEIAWPRTVVGFTLVAGTFIVLLFRLKREASLEISGDPLDNRNQDLRFWRRWSLLVLLSGAITLYWARFQPGRLYYFNTFYAGALWLSFLLLTLYACLPAARENAGLWNVGLDIATIALCSGIWLAPNAWRRDNTWPPVSYDYHVRVQVGTEVDHLLTRYPPGSRPVVLRFYAWRWHEATTLALELQRRGIPVFVDPGWEGMFGRQLVWRELDHPSPVFWILSGDAKDVDAPDAALFMYSAVVARTNDTDDPKLKQPIRD